MKSLLCALLLLVPASAFADLKFVVKDDTTSYTIHIKGQKVRMDYFEPTTPPRPVYEVIDQQAQRNVIVDRATGRVATLPYDPAAEAEIMKRMYADQAFDVRATGQERTVNGFRCKEYRVTVGGPFPKDVTYWVTDQVDIAEFDLFRHKVDMAFQRLGPDVRKIPGMPIRVEIRMRDDPARPSVIDVTGVSREPLSDALFVVPAK
jgi:hypothetical protein